MTDGKLNYNPLYLQVRDVLYKRIVEEEYSPGKAIPSESKLASDFGTSISTIRQALSLLVAEGVLVKKQGKGTIVSDRKVKITFLSWMQETPRGGEILAELVRKFEAGHPSIAVEIIPTTYPETRNALTRLIGSGGAPDVAQIVSHWTSYFASTGALEPLDALLSKENISSRLPVQDLLGGTFQNRIYSVAWGLCPIALVANRNVLSAAGVEIPRSPLTLSEFLDCCRRIDCIEARDPPAAFGLWYTPGVENDYLSIYTFLQAFGGELIDDSGVLRFDSPENVAGFGWLRELVTGNRIFASDIFTIRRRFAENRIGFISDGPWIKYLLEEITGEDFDANFQVLLNPVQASADSRSWMYNHALAVCSQSRNKLQAARFVEAITSELSAWYSSQVGILPPRHEVLSAPDFSNGFFATYREQLRHAKSIDARNPMFERAMVLCVDAVKKILFEGASIEKELAEKEHYLRMLYYD
ncbi:MAG TPA: extracellular solute-binding protein [Spirochaetia bacterium]|nr:extracellular solute-binding protein [Spirochaetia bacterium]